MFAASKCLACFCMFLGLSLAVLIAPANGQPLQLRVVGGLAGVSQYEQFEAPFWTDEISRLTQGRVVASIHPFDRSGLRGQDMLQLLRLGVVPFGTALLSQAAGDEPELGVIDLPGLNPDFDTLRRNLGAFRPHLAEILQTRHDLVLLGVYVYPAQVLYCTRSFQSLADLVGRRVRTSSISQSEMVAALGAIPVVTPFSEIVSAVQRRVVDCAITGTLSGYQIGLSQHTSHTHSSAISWGLSVFVANRAAWSAIPDEIQAIIRNGISALEQRIWDAAHRDTQVGHDCNTGRAACPVGQARHLVLVEPSAADTDVLRDVLQKAVLPRWIERCGESCAVGWNKTIGAANDLIFGTDGTLTSKPSLGNAQPPARSAR